MKSLLLRFPDEEFEALKLHSAELRLPAGIYLRQLVSVQIDRDIHLFERAAAAYADALTKVDATDEPMPQPPTPSLSPDARSNEVFHAYAVLRDWTRDQ